MYSSIFFNSFNASLAVGLSFGLNLIILSINLTKYSLYISFIFSLLIFLLFFSIEIGNSFETRQSMLKPKPNISTLQSKSSIPF